MRGLLIVLLSAACSQGGQIETAAVGDVVGTVLLSDGRDPGGALVVVASDAAFADEAGGFAFLGVPVGDHTAVATLDGYLLAEAAVTVSKDATATIELTLEAEPGNRPPRLISLTTDAAPEPSGTTTVTGAATDPDGDALTWTFEVDAPWTVSASGSAATVTAPDAWGAGAVVRATVTDPSGAAASGWIALGTPPNLPPVFLDAFIDRMPLGRDGTASVTALGSDPEGLGLTWTGAVDGGWSLSLAADGTGTLDAPDAYGATATVTLTATDSEGQAVTVEVPVRTEDNVAPVIDALVADRTVLDPGGEASLVVHARDDDPLTWKWAAPPVGWTLSAAGDEATVTAPASTGAPVTIEVVVRDDAGGSATGRIGLSTRANRAPTLAGLVATPNPAAYGAPITVIASASDPDGDALTWTWDAGTWTITGSGTAIAVTPPAGGAGTGTTVGVLVEDPDGASVSGEIAVSAGACVDAFEDCDGSSANGCEVDTVTDAAHCGGCDASCPDPGDGVATCLDGVSCVVDCFEGAVLDASGTRCLVPALVEDLGATAWWRMVGDSTSPDAIGTADGTWEGGVDRATGATADGDSARAFLGVVSAMRVDPAPFPTKDLTVSLFFRADPAGLSPSGTPGVGGTLLSYSTAASGEDTLLIQHPGALRVDLLGTTVQIGADLDDRAWHHLALTRAMASGDTEVWIDGTRVSETAGVAPGATFPTDGILILGQDQDSHGGNFQVPQSYHGVLDEVAWFPRVLTELEIAAVAGLLAPRGITTCQVGTCPSSCTQVLAADPGAPTGLYEIRRDGASFVVTCDMETDGGGWTGIGHDREPWFRSFGCENPYCHEALVDYDLPDAILLDFATASSERRQLLAKRCRDATLTDYTDYRSLGGTDHGNGQWPGGAAQCDLNDPIFRTSGGLLTSAAPVDRIRNGDVGSGGEDAYFTLGKVWLR